MAAELVKRAEPCRSCGYQSGILVGVVDYWDIRRSVLVLCPQCNLIQLDPMLTAEETSKGCYAYYIEEMLGTSGSEYIRNMVRNFRRGVVFGHSLKRRKITPQCILETGPGSGYFSAGLQFVFPGVGVTVMDINREVLDFNRRHHNYLTCEGIPDNFIPALANRFDLVVARDVLEHVADISAVLSNLRAYLKPGGYLHFITPNGKEDVWKHHLAHTLANTPSELLINHVNYFDGKGLNELLIRTGFIPVKYYAYGIKTTLRGKGWKHTLRLMVPVSQKHSADQYIREKSGEVKRVDLHKNAILKQWYIRPGAPRITLLYSLYQHSSLIRLNPVRNSGHEFYGLFRRAKE
jgi:SAM-dependent methyltransferase